MGKALSMLSKPIKEFNIESRAHKIISKNKPIPAPMHKSSEIVYEKYKAEHPEVFDELQSKNKTLDKNLKDIFVKSYDPPINPDKKNENPNRPLPSNRAQIDDFEFGFKEPEKVPIGRVTLRGALKFITDHQADSKKCSIEKISEEYLIDEDKIRKILKYFRVFEVYVPEQRQVKAKFAGPSVPRIRITTEKRKELPLPIDKKDKT